jgi:hypothetical protein
MGTRIRWEEVFKKEMRRPMPGVPVNNKIEGQLNRVNIERITY